MFQGLYTKIQTIVPTRNKYIMASYPECDKSFLSLHRAFPSDLYSLENTHSISSISLVTPCSYCIFFWPARPQLQSWLGKNVDQRRRMQAGPRLQNERLSTRPLTADCSELFRQPPPVGLGTCLALLSTARTFRPAGAMERGIRYSRSPSTVPCTPIIRVFQTTPRAILPIEVVPSGD